MLRFRLRQLGRRIARRGDTMWRLRKLRDQHQRGELSAEDYAAAFAVINAQHRIACADCADGYATLVDDSDGARLCGTCYLVRHAEMTKPA